MIRMTPCYGIETIGKKREKKKKKKEEERKKEKREEGRVWRRWGEPLLRMCAGRANEMAEDGRRWADGSRELAMRICTTAGRREMERTSSAWRGREGKGQGTEQGTEEVVEVEWRVVYFLGGFLFLKYRVVYRCRARL